MILICQCDHLVKTIAKDLTQFSLRFLTSSGC